MKRAVLKSIALAAMISTAMAVTAQAEEISVIVSGGIQGDASEEAFTKPFEEATGIKVNTLKIQPGSAKLRLQMETGVVDFDVAIQLESTGAKMYQDGLLSAIDYSIYKPDELIGIDPAARTAWGVESFEVAFLMARNSDYYKDGKAAPQSWADFWNVEQFPGRRLLMTGQTGIQGPWEEALLADGVKPEELYPLDIDRVFRSLDKIKPQIRKWWFAAEIEQLMSANTMDMTMSFDTSASSLISAGKPIEINYNQAKVYGLYWFIPKASKNQEAAQKFIEFATRAENQAKFAQLYGAAPPNTGAFKYIDEGIAKKLITHPDNKKNSYRINMGWYAEVGPDGKTNADQLRERWNTWIAQ